MKTAALLALLLPPALGARAQETPFDEWLVQLRAEAAALGIGEATLANLDGLEPLERVLELDNAQPEFVQTFTRYLGLRVTPSQIDRGRTLLAEHAGLLGEVHRRYGVQPHYLVSFWAIESNYGGVTGAFPVLGALATLAHDPRRAGFFRNELLAALRIIDEGHIAPARMSGSWAGAMGQLQFLPSVFERYGVDGDGDGRVDIWESLPDVFHSAAHFLSSRGGWRRGERWGREALLPAGFDYSLAGARDDARRPLAEWSALGVRRVDGSPLPAADMEASVILPSGADGPAFLAYDNFRATMDYNPSVFYALTVGHLADRYTGEPAIQRMPANEERLSREDVYEIQRLLAAAGHDAGEPDGRIGRRTRAAIRAFQRERELPMDGHASARLLRALRGGD